METTPSSPGFFDDSELQCLLETFAADGVANVVDCVEGAGGGGNAATQQQLAVTNTPSPPSQPHQPHDVVTKRRVRSRQTAASRRSDPNKARNERKHELLLLQSTVRELETQLQTLHSRVANNSNQPQNDASAIVRHTNHSRNSSAAERVWRELIERQLALRTRAERERIRLTLAVAAQHKVATKLHELLVGSRTATRALEQLRAATACCASPQAMPQALTRSQVDTIVFESLLRGAAQAFRDVDTVLAANGLSPPLHASFSALSLSTVERFSHAHVTRDATTGRNHMALIASQVLPFDLQATRDAVWRHFAIGKESVPHRVHTALAPTLSLPTLPSCLKTFHLDVHAERKRVRFAIKQVLQQHTDNERVVIVWQAAIDPVAFTDAAPPHQLLPRDVGVIETGYVVLTPLDRTTECDANSSNDDSAAAALTLLQTCHIITPQAVATHAIDTNAIDTNAFDTNAQRSSSFFENRALTDFVLRATAANVSTSFDTIEDALLTQAIRTTSAS